MDTLRQYIDLYQAMHQSLDAHSAGALNRRRHLALERLLRADGLPEKGQEGYEKTSLARMLAPDLGVNVERVDIPVDVAATFRCAVPNISSLLAVVVNDRFVPSASLERNLPKGVTVCSLARGAELYPELVDTYYGSVAGTDNVATALNTLLAQDGVLIHIDRDVRVEKPIQIVSILATPVPLLALRRVLVVAEAGAHCAILKCDHTQTLLPDDPPACVSSEVVEIVAHHGAHVDWYDLEESSPQTGRISQLYARQESDSHLNVCIATLRNGTTRNELSVRIEGEGADTHLNGMAIGSGSQHIDNQTIVRHLAGRSHSDQLFKYVLDGASQGVFSGLIEVAPGARFVEAYQSNRNILASVQARMHSKPHLLIYNDDVKCSHGASTGQLDDEALFYMQTRGIPPATGRRMLMQAFMVDVVDAIGLESLRDRLRHMLQQRFDNTDSAAASCATCQKSSTSPDANGHGC